MDLPSPPAEPVEAPVAPDPVLQRYAKRMRRARWRYLGALGVLALAAGVFAAVAWSRGEITHTTLTTVDHPPPNVAFAAPAASVQPAWRSTDHTAVGTPFAGGTVVTYDEHSVRGRDGRTGAVTWTYSRSDRTVCSVAAVDGVAIALYRLHGDCNQVTTLDAQTGERRWTRTLDEDTQTLLGTPTVQVSDAGVMFASSTVIYEVYPLSGIDRWIYSPDGCTIHRAVQGTSGVLISQTCKAGTTCPDPTLCGSGQQLLLRDGQLGRDDTSGAKNPDRILWNQLGNTDVPVSAGAVVSALNAAGTLDTYFGTEGAKHAITLSPAPPANVYASPDAIGSVDATDDELVFLGTTTYRLTASPSAAVQAWAASTSGPPTITSPPVSFGTEVPTEVIVAPGTGGAFVLLDSSAGTVTRTYSVGLPGGSIVYPFGSGFVAAGAQTVVYR